MATPRVRFFVFWFVCFIAFPELNAAVAEPSPQNTTAAEPAGPAPSAAVEKMLAESSRLAEAKQPLESLKAAGQALEAARQTHDKAGEAFAQQARAKSLQVLERKNDALDAWQEAALIWARTGDTPEEITALVQAGLLSVEDKQSEADRLFSQGLAVGKIETQRPVALAQVLHDSGVAIGVQGLEPMAMEYLTAALALREKQTPESVKVVETLNALGKMSYNRGTRNTDIKSYDLAKSFLTRAVEMGRRVAPDSPLVVESLLRLGTADLQATDADTVAVQKLYLEALQIQRKLAPDGSVEEATILRKIGILGLDLADYGKAHEYFNESVVMLERQAPESRDLEYGVEDLGLAESGEGDLSSARDHLLRALAMLEKLHDNLGSIFVNLGSVANDQYDFAAARDYYEKALAIFTKTDPHTVGIPVVLRGLSEVFYRQGDLASALEYGRHALARTEETEPDSDANADDLVLVGNILREQGNFSSAADYYRRGLDMWEKEFPGSLRVSETLVGLAKLARAQQNRNLAVDYDRRALEMGQKSCPNSWCVPEILNDLGELAYEQGDLTGSESYLRRAVDIREKSLGPMHPDLARSLNSLALTVAALGRTPGALEAALRAESIGAEHVRLSARTLSERQALAYEGIRASGLDGALTLTADRKTTPAARSQVFDAVIHSRALVFDELAARHRSAYRSGDREVAQLADQLSSARTRLATLVFRGVGDTKPEAYRKLLDDTRQAKEEAERMLAEKSLAFRQEQARTQIGVKEIAASLPPGTALVAFIRYARHDLQKPGAGKAPPEPVPSYAAFILRARTPEPVFVPLGAASEIEGPLAAWRRDIARQAEALDASAKTSEIAYRRPGAALRRRIWDPLVPGLGDAKEVFVVPDAALHLVSLAALPVGSSQYLVESGPLIHYLSAERDLVPAESRHGEGILVIGNPAFDETGKLAVAANQQSGSGAPATATAGALLRGTRSACGTFQTLHFPSLPGSQQEAENIAALWKQSNRGKGAPVMRGSAVQPGGGQLLQMTGPDASPEAFEQNAPGKRVLHVATHGFFLEGSCESAVQRRLDATKRDETFLPATAENPLLLSGLAFAGANRRSSAKPDESDGILTAEEIAGINLEGVDWAVLSACDTGVGEIRVGEGVFGLRRAFQVAGAKTVIMSLWPVEDETTRQWMGTLYREHFLNGKDTGEAVRAASLQILRQRRAKHQSTHPFYWAPFIAAGDWN
jgi:CHAT domain-containing protein/tetratricopeptide (TPR) repeat protein